GVLLMLYMTFLHWTLVAVFTLVFILLVILSSREQNKKTLLSMIFSSFLLVSVGIGFSLFALDKYTKKAKLISSSQKRDYRKESVIVKGKIKNVGKFKIGYCNAEIRISNDTSGYGNRKKAYFTPSKSLGSLFGSKDVKSNIITEEYRAIEDLDPKKTKSFKISMPYPSHFVNPKYKVKIFCH
nr:DUF2393 domain-containing protein [Campylobacterota bacterium]